MASASSSPHLFAGMFHLVLLPVAAVLGAVYVPLQIKTAVWACAYGAVCAFAFAAGYHRMFAHRAFKATAPLKAFLAFFGAANLLGPVTVWARDHRAHHRAMDTDKDPFNRQRGFWYAYLGARLRDLRHVGDADVKDLTSDAIVALQAAIYPVLATVMGFVVPAAVASTWGDVWGGLVYAGLWRTLVFQQSHFLTWALSRTIGSQPYSDHTSGRNHSVLGVLTLGESNINFHNEFPNDYRLGPAIDDVDPVKWIIRALAVVGLAYDLNVTPQDQVTRLRLQRREAELQALRAQIKWGPKPETLPRWTKAEFDQKVAEGRQLLIMDSIAHDVSQFYDDHPGGAEVLKPKIGKDATIAFNGGVQRHSKAARNLATFMRVAYVENATDLRKDVQAKKAKQKLSE